MGYGGVSLAKVFMWGKLGGVSQVGWLEWGGGVQSGGVVGWGGQLGRPK